ncbi:MAG: DNA repair protein RecO [Dehalococcoidia bacterium]
MPRPRVYKTEAIILKQTPLGEADKILILYTPHLGKLRTVAKGIRRPKSRLAGHLEPLTHSTLMLAQGRNLDVISQCDTLESFIALKSDLWRTTCAIYAAELVDSFTLEHEENNVLYDLLLETLRWLETGHRQELVLRFFEVRLLQHLGYQPQLRICVSCSSALEPTLNYFSASGGGILCPRCRHKEPLARPLSVDVLKVMRFLQEKDRAEAERLKISKKLGQELEHILREYIRYMLEREVRSVAFLDLLRDETVRRASPENAL